MKSFKLSNTAYRIKGEWRACVARKAATDVEHHHVEPEVASLVEHHTGLFDGGFKGLWFQANRFQREN
ncbi:hypothetical protein DPMN_066176 [Dreissena polymorpha]|uniref:Uncharacterized protein n=1 Tax=Dreissena polymorpha TaxID=45954 RepID=A0A9D4BK93_DREPO|nr:hypothetical protein DPMN_066176 [Dreissena polymorpha]